MMTYSTGRNGNKRGLAQHRGRRAAAVLAATCALAGTRAALAADVTWDADTAAAGAQDGSGAWNTSNTNWLNGGVNTTWNNAANDTAIFGNSTGGPNTVTLGTGITAGGLTFNTGPAYTVTGNTLSLASGATITTNGNATIGSIIGGTGPLTKAGFGSLSLTTAGTRTGGLTVNAGTVNFNATALGVGAPITINAGGRVNVIGTNALRTVADTSPVTLSTGGVLHLTATHAHLATVNLNGGMIVGSGGSKYDGEDVQLDGDVTVDGTAPSLISLPNGFAIKGARTFIVNDVTGDFRTDLLFNAELEQSDSGAPGPNANLVKSGSGTMVMSANNSHAGTTTINAGTLQIGLGGTTGNLGSTTAITNNGVLAFNHARGTNIAVAAPIGGNGSLVVGGIGGVTLSGTNTFTGPTTIQNSGGFVTGDGLVLNYATNNTDKLPDSQTVTIHGGNLTVTGSAAAATSETIGGLSLMGQGGVTVNPGAGQTATLNLGAISRTSGATLAIRTAGTLGSDVLVNTSTALGGWAYVTTATNTNGTFATLDGSNNIVPLVPDQTTSAGTPLSGATSAQNWLVTGTTAAEKTINAGTVTLNTIVTEADTFIDSPGQLVVGSGGLLLRGTSHAIKASNADGVTGRGNLTTGLATGELFIHTSAAYYDTGVGVYDIRAQIVNNGATPTILVKSGPGQLTLSDAHTYTGGTLINMGRLRITNVNALGTGSVDIRPGGQLWLSGITFARNLNLAGYGSEETGGLFGAVRLDNGSNLSGSVTINGETRIGLSSGATAILSGPLLGSGDLQLVQTGGTSFLRLTGDMSSFTGRLVALSGNFRVQADSNFGPVPASYKPDAIVLGGGGIQGGTTTGNNLTINANRGITLLPGTTGNLHAWSGFTIQVDSPITGAGNLGKTDGGIAALTAVNTYTGQTTVFAGTLTAQGNAVIANTSGLRVRGGGTFRIQDNGIVNVLNELYLGDANSESGTLTQTGGVLNALTTTADSIRLAHWPSETGTFNLQGGIANITGTPTTVSWDGTGVLNVSGGTGNFQGLTLGRASAARNSTVTLSGGTLNIGSSGIVIPTGGTGTKTVTLSGGTLGALASWSSAVPMALSGAGPTVNPGANTITLSGALSGAGNLTKAGPGGLTLSGPNTYTGNTIVDSGTLTITGTGTIATSAALTVAAGATVSVSGVTTPPFVYPGAVSGSGSIIGDINLTGSIAPGTSPGTLTVSGALGLADTTVLNYELNGADTTAGGGVNDLVAGVTNLTLDGTLNVAETTAGSFLSAQLNDRWTLLDYSGTLADNGLALGTTPALPVGLTWEVQINTANTSVDLVAVPEPGALGTMAAFISAGLLARRRRKNA